MQRGPAANYAELTGDVEESPGGVEGITASPDDVMRGVCDRAQPEAGLAGRGDGARG